MTTTTTALVKGQRYVGTMTAKVGGKRIYRDVTFTSARDQEPEPLVRDAKEAPDQDRVFSTSGPYGSVPRLFVAGTIREAAAA